MLLDLTLAVNRRDRVLARQIKAVGMLADGLGNEQIGASVCVCGTPNRARNLAEADCIRDEVRPTGIVFEEGSRGRSAAVQDR